MFVCMCVCVCVCVFMHTHTHTHTFQSRLVQNECLCVYIQMDASVCIHSNQKHRHSTDNCLMYVYSGGKRGKGLMQPPPRAQPKFFLAKIGLNRLNLFFFERVKSGSKLSENSSDPISISACSFLFFFQ